jgi:hypothetical protein
VILLLKAAMVVLCVEEKAGFSNVALRFLRIFSGKIFP